MGVFKASSLLLKLGEGAMGLNSSEGKVPDPGVCSVEVEAVLALLSKPAAAMVAVAVAEAMVASRRRLAERVTEESNE